MTSVDEATKKIDEEPPKIDCGSRSMSIQKINYLKESKQSVKSGDSVQLSNLKGAQYSIFGKLSSHYPSNHEETFGARDDIRHNHNQLVQAKSHIQNARNWQQSLMAPNLNIKISDLNEIEKKDKDGLSQDLDSRVQAESHIKIENINVCKEDNPEQGSPKPSPKRSQLEDQEQRDQKEKEMETEDVQDEEQLAAQVKDDNQMPLDANFEAKVE